MGPVSAASRLDIGFSDASVTLRGGTVSASCYSSPPPPGVPGEVGGLSSTSVRSRVDSSAVG